MAIGIVNNSDFEKELKNLNGIKTDDDREQAIITSIDRGRGSNDLQVPDSLRKVIGEDAIENGRSSGKDLANAMSISDSSLSAYTKGAHSTANYNEGNKDLKQHTDAVRKRIGSKARAKLLMAMGTITKEKLEGAKLRDVASVANAMSNVIRNIEGPTEQGNNQTNFIFYAPKTREESQFEVINLKEG